MRVLRVVKEGNENMRSPDRVPWRKRDRKNGEVRRKIQKIQGTAT